MAKVSTVKIIEQCLVCPQRSSSSSSPPITSLPLTFLDIPWLFFPPSQPLFFYEFPYPTSHFTSVLLPNLKHSLSLALQRFRPLAGTLILPPRPLKPEIACGEADSISFAVAESDGDFNHLSSPSCQRDAKEFHKLVPKLLPLLLSRDDDARDKHPLLVIQVTMFPNFGFTIGLAFHHAVADGRTFNNFMRVWSTLCSDLIGRGSDHHLDHWSCYDRAVIVDSHGLEGIFLKEWWKRRCNLLPMVSAKAVELCDMVRATFVMGLDDMERVKGWIVTAQCKRKSKPHSLDFSPYVLTCAFLWVCLVKTQEIGGGLTNGHSLNEDLNYFGFIAGGLTRVGYPVPVTYFGNCIGFGRAMAVRGELIGEDGILVAATAIRGTIKMLDKAMFSQADKWVAEWQTLIGSDIHIIVSGSPKLDLYEKDFGWGRPKKIEEIEIDTTKAISLSESRNVKGGMEIGMVLPKPQMEAFAIIFKEGLKGSLVS